MPYPAQVNTFADAAEWAPSIIGSFATSATTRYVFSARNTLTAALRRLRAYKSTDTGNTWAEVDSANAITIADAGQGRNFWPVEDGTSFRIAFSGPGPELRIVTFSTTTDTWGATISGGPVPDTQHGFSDDGGNYKVQMVKHSVTGDYWLTYQGPADLVLGNLKDRVYGVQYSGAWGVPFRIFGIAGENLDYTPTGIIEATASRMHCFATSCDGGTNYSIYHRAMSSAGVLSGQQTIVTDVHPVQEPHVSPPVFDGTRVWVGFARLNNPGNNWNSADVRATSADTPAWTEEDVDATPIGDSAGFQLNSLAVLGTTVYAVWCDINIFGSETLSYASNANLAGWSAPTLVGTNANYTDWAFTRGLAGLGLSIFTAPFGGDLFYTEIAIASPAASGSSSSGGGGGVGGVAAPPPATPPPTGPSASVLSSRSKVHRRPPSIMLKPVKLGDLPRDACGHPIPPKDAVYIDYTCWLTWQKVISDGSTLVDERQFIGERFFQLRAVSCSNNSDLFLRFQMPDGRYLSQAQFHQATVIGVGTRRLSVQPERPCAPGSYIGIEVANATGADVHLVLVFEGVERVYYIICPDEETCKAA